VKLPGRVRQIAHRLRLPELRAAVKDFRYPYLQRRDRRDTRRMRTLLARHLAVDSNCVDVGAFKGSILQMIEDLAPSGHHIAYEPVPQAAASLAARFPTFDIRPIALSDHEGTATFYEPKDFPGWGSLHQGWELPNDSSIVELPVTLRRLDDDLPQGYAPSFIKVDTEGAEGEVLRGALETIRAHKPLVVFEHGGSVGDAPDVATSTQIYESIRDAGLRLFDIDGHGPLTREAFLQTVARRKLWNFVARV
jgi:FkbM family methyltransferase